MPPSGLIGLGMKSEIVCIFHYPFAMFCLLPFIYGLGRVDFYIIYIAHGKGMEIDLHCYILAELDSLVNKFRRHRKYFCDHVGTGSSHFLVLELGSIGTAELDEVYPATQGTIHVQSALHQTFGQHSTGLFFGYAFTDSPFVGFSRLSDEISLYVFPTRRDVEVLVIIEVEPN